MSASDGVAEVLLLSAKRVNESAAKANLLRLRQDIPLADAGLVAVEEGIVAYERLLATLADVPTPTGSTPLQLMAARLVQLEEMRGGNSPSTELGESTRQ